MRARLATVCLALSTLVATGCQSESPMASARSDGWSYYGLYETVDGPIVSLGAISGGESNVVVEGTITDVCPKKGCWMKVVEGDDELFVRFQDYGFFVPMNAQGHRVTMHGTAVADVASVEELQHYALDAGKSPEEIMAITEPETRVTFFADSVYIDGAGLDAPFAP